MLARNIEDYPIISLDKRPQVLLLGNGLSRCCGSDSWENIIRGYIKTYNRSFSYKEIEGLPANMQAVVATGNSINSEMKNISNLYMKEIADADKRFINQVLDIPADIILTTNYDYNIEQGLGLKAGKYPFQRSRRWTKEVSGIQKQFGLFQYSVVGGDNKRIISHIHGDICQPTGMVMGHYYYGKLLAHIINYLPDFMRRHNISKNQGQPYKPLSWVDYFLIGDVHVIGSNLYACEADLWWLFECKKTHFPDSRVYYYHRQDEDIETSRKIMMEHMNIEIIGTDFIHDSQDNVDDYRNNYLSTSRIIKSNICKLREER